MNNAFQLRSRQYDSRINSTSGGVFYTIAKTIIERKGVVYGVCLNDSFKACHLRVTTIEDLEKLRGSKYIQSNVGDCFNLIKKDLDNNMLVCFSGTPCQVYGLYNYLGKDYTNLILIEVACFSVASPKSLDLFLNYIDVDKSEISKIVFRDKKKYGYQNSQFIIYGRKENILYSSGAEKNQFLRAFVNNYSTRPSCYKCPFKKDHRKADFTIWDCYFPKNKIDRDNSGCSSMLINSDRGMEYFKTIESFFDTIEVDYKSLLESEESLNFSSKPSINREGFMKELSNGNNPFDKYLKITLKVKVSSFVRKLLIKLHLYSKIKRMFSSIKNRKKYAK